MRLLASFLRFFFYHFYHSFAWTYDFVAALVSLGRWGEWVQAVIPFIEGKRVLELGHGPGHLQRSLRAQDLFSVGLDESPQMGRLAARRMRRAGCTQVNLARGLVQSLPFPAETFDTVISTFPSDYIFDPRTFSEVRRVLRIGGLFVVLPVAWIRGRGLLDRVMAWVLRVTGESPHPIERFRQRMKRPLEQAGFRVTIAQVEIRSSIVMVALAEKLL